VVIMKFFELFLREFGENDEMEFGHGSQAGGSKLPFV
jgi:hypothetical protein